MNIVDAHHHVWDLAVRDQPFLRALGAPELLRTFSIADLRPAAAHSGVTETVLVQTVTDTGETPELLALAGADPLVAAVVGWTDLTIASVADDLARLCGGPDGRYLTGVRHPAMTEADPDWLRRPDVLRGLRALAAAGLTYDLIVLPHQLPAATYAAAAVPDLMFVLDHGGNPDIAGGAVQPWATAIGRLAALPNTVCKLSGLATAGPAAVARAAAAPFADVILTEFGAGRVMFGSDWPVCLLDTDYAGAVALARSLTDGLPEPDRAAVFAGTARRVYRLPAAASET